MIIYIVRGLVDEKSLEFRICLAKNSKFH